MSRFKRFIKWLLFAALPASQPRSSLDNVLNLEKKNEITTSRIDLIVSFFCNHLFGISSLTPSTSFEVDTSQWSDGSDDAGDFAWNRADFLDADSDSDEIGGKFISNANFSSVFNNDDHRYRSCEINPANGLPMLDDCIDILGNPYGTDSGDSGSTLWEDHSLDSFMEDGFGANGSFDISGSTDPWDT